MPKKENRAAVVTQRVEGSNPCSDQGFMSALKIPVGSRIVDFADCRRAVDITSWGGGVNIE